MSGQYLEVPNTEDLDNSGVLDITSSTVDLGRVLGDILFKKTKTPADFQSFYLFMTSVKDDVDFLDFWIAYKDHLDLCKGYVSGLREAGVEATSKTVNQLGKQESLAELLELIINENILDEDNTIRLSQFLRGDIDLDTVDPKLKESVEKYNSKEQVNQQAAAASGKLYYDQKDPAFPQPPLNPLTVEKLLKETKHTSNLFITRDNLKESIYNLLLRYIVEDLDKSLNIPDRLNKFVIDAIEVDGRYDPAMFEGIIKYVSNRIENDSLPKFLKSATTRNVTRTSQEVRSTFAMFFFIVLAMTCLGSLASGLRKKMRVLFLLMSLLESFFIVTSIHRVDPILVLLKQSETIIPNKYYVRVNDPFIQKSLSKRLMWVVLQVLLLTALVMVVYEVTPQA